MNGDRGVIDAFSCVELEVFVVIKRRRNGVKTHLRCGEGGLGLYMNTIVVATFNERAPARVLQERLAAAGMDAVLHDETKLERYWFMAEPVAAMHIEVPRRRYLEARRLIGDWDRQDGILREAVRCPECRGSRIEFPQITRKFLTPMLMRFFMSIGIMRKEYYCEDCHFTWPLKVPQPPPDADILGFPRGSRY